MNQAGQVWKSCNGRTYKKEREKIYVQKSDGTWHLVATGFSQSDFEKHVNTKWQSPKSDLPTKA